MPESQEQESTESPFVREARELVRCRAELVACRRLLIELTSAALQTQQFLADHQMPRCTRTDRLRAKLIEAVGYLRRRTDVPKSGTGDRD